ncbi:Uncharacterised protein [Vibrio cholerae]|nr:Uncharacterised protein [Vibrio cholerae]CSD53505.1 Uncharacterised protein [Vibrio cholerae]
MEQGFEHPFAEAVTILSLELLCMSDNLPQVCAANMFLDEAFLCTPFEA